MAENASKNTGAKEGPSVKIPSYIDQFAYKAAVDLAASQPRCDQTTNQLQVLALPSSSDTVPIWHMATGQTEQVSIATLAAIFQGSVGGPLAYNADLSGLGLYNYGFFGGVPSASTGTNSTAMTSMLAAMGALNGGLGGGAAFINVGTYNINTGPYYIPTQTSMTSPGLTVGTGNSGNIQSTFYVQNNGTLFTTNPQSIGWGGTYIQNIGISWANATGQSTGNIAFDCSHSSNVRLHQCMFQSCPIALHTDHRSNSVGLTECTINYLGPSGVGPGGWSPGSLGTTGAGFCAIQFGSPECYAIGPSDFSQKPPSSGGPLGNTCIGITQSAEHTYIHNLHLSDWDVGISYNINPNNTSNGVKYSHVGFLEINAWTSGVFIQAWTSTAVIYSEKYVSCTIFQSQSSTVTGNALIYVDANGGPNNNVEDIEFVNCTVYQSGGHGLQINTGNNIRVTGGTYSGNSSSGGAGIAITGACGYVQVTNANLNPRYNNAANLSNQQYAILITGSPVQPVIINNCMMNNYAGAPVHVTGSPSELRIINCVGYNDQNTVISTVAPTSSTNSSAQTAAGLGSGAINYYGPSMVTGIANASGSTIHISGTAYAVPANGFFCFMLPNPSDQWFWTVNAPANFTWLGK